MDLRIGFSPCPNDTFIFDALVNGRIDPGPFHFHPFIADVEQLNHETREGRLDVSKISTAAYPDVSGNYIMLEAGGALGRGVGPVLVAGRMPLPADRSGWRVAIPGIHTTANLLLSEFFPEITHKVPMLFSEIESAVLEGRVDAGLLIHEGRFTYASKGLQLVYDLGQVWESRTGAALPLGCIVASRQIPHDQLQLLNNLIKMSLLFARKDPDPGSAFIRQHAAEMIPEVIEKHIALYVNDFSVALGPEGKSAVRKFLDFGAKQGMLAPCFEPVFI